MEDFVVEICVELQRRQTRVACSCEEEEESSWDDVSSWWRILRGRSFKPAKGSLMRIVADIVRDLTVSDSSH